MEDGYDELDDVIMQKRSKGESVKKEHDIVLRKLYIIPPLCAKYSQ